MASPKTFPEFWLWRRGEGSWALTREFSVAGYRRMVSTNWVVDDEATSTLISFVRMLSRCYVRKTQRATTFSESYFRDSAWRCRIFASVTLR